MKPLQWHPLARLDADEAADRYAAQGGLALELRFIQSLDTAIAQVADQPGMGAPRYADVLKLSGLRLWPLKGFPYLVFYLERNAHIDIWRVLHAQRDIPVWMGESLE